MSPCRYQCDVYVTAACAGFGDTDGFDDGDMVGLVVFGV